MHCAASLASGPVPPEPSPRAGPWAGRGGAAPPARRTPWGSQETERAVSALPSHRRWAAEEAAGGAAQPPTGREAEGGGFVRLENATVVFPGYAVASVASVASGPGGAGAVAYALSAACDDRSLHAPPLEATWSLPSDATGLVLLAQFWGSEFYHWMVRLPPPRRRGAV
jgi:hypothetical protein